MFPGWDPSGDRSRPGSDRPAPISVPLALMLRAGDQDSYNETIGRHQRHATWLQARELCFSLRLEERRFTSRRPLRAGR